MAVADDVQVESAPTVIKTGMKKEDAEALKAKLEAGADGNCVPASACMMCSATMIDGNSG